MSTPIDELKKRVEALKEQKEAIDRKVAEKTPGKKLEDNLDGVVAANLQRLDPDKKTNEVRRGSDTPPPEQKDESLAGILARAMANRRPGVQEHDNDDNNKDEDDDDWDIAEDKRPAKKQKLSEPDSAATNATSLADREYLEKQIQYLERYVEAGDTFLESDVTLDAQTSPISTTTNATSSSSSSGLLTASAPLPSEGLPGGSPLPSSPPAVSTGTPQAQLLAELQGLEASKRTAFIEKIRACKAEGMGDRIAFVKVLKENQGIFSKDLQGKLFDNLNASTPRVELEAIQQAVVGAPGLGAAPLPGGSPLPSSPPAVSTGTPQAQLLAELQGLEASKRTAFIEKIRACKAEGMGDRIAFVKVLKENQGIFSKDLQGKLFDNLNASTPRVELEAIQQAVVGAPGLGAAPLPGGSPLPSSPPAVSTGTPQAQLLAELQGLEASKRTAFIEKIRACKAEGMGDRIAFVKVLKENQGIFSKDLQGKLFDNLNASTPRAELEAIQQAVVGAPGLGAAPLPGGSPLSSSPPAVSTGIPQAQLLAELQGLEASKRTAFIEKIRACKAEGMGDRIAFVKVLKENQGIFSKDLQGKLFDNLNASTPRVELEAIQQAVVGAPGLGAAPLPGGSPLPSSPPAVSTGTPQAQLLAELQGLEASKRTAFIEKIRACKAEGMGDRIAFVKVLKENQGIFSKDLQGKLFDNLNASTPRAELEAIQQAVVGAPGLGAAPLPGGSPLPSSPPAVSTGTPQAQLLAELQGLEASKRTAFIEKIRACKAEGMGDRIAFVKVLKENQGIFSKDLQGKLFDNLNASTPRVELEAIQQAVVGAPGLGAAPLPGGSPLPSSPPAVSTGTPQAQLLAELQGLEASKRTAFIEKIRACKAEGMGDRIAFVKVLKENQGIFSKDLQGKLFDNLNASTPRAELEAIQQAVVGAPGLGAAPLPGGSPLPSSPPAVSTGTPQAQLLAELQGLEASKRTAFIEKIRACKAEGMGDRIAFVKVLKENQGIFSKDLQGKLFDNLNASTPRVELEAIQQAVVGAPGLGAAPLPGGSPLPSSPPAVSTGIPQAQLLAELQGLEASKRTAFIEKIRACKAEGMGDRIAFVKVLKENQGIFSKDLQGKLFDNLNASTPRAELEAIQQAVVGAPGLGAAPLPGGSPLPSSPPAVSTGTPQAQLLAELQGLEASKRTAFIEKIRACKAEGMGDRIAFVKVLKENQGIFSKDLQGKLFDNLNASTPRAELEAIQQAVVGAPGLGAAPLPGGSPLPSSPPAVSTGTPQAQLLAELQGLEASKRTAFIEKIRACKAEGMGDRIAFVKVLKENQGIFSKDLQGKLFDNLNASTPRAELEAIQQAVVGAPGLGAAPPPPPPPPPAPGGLPGGAPIPSSSAAQQSLQAVHAQVLAITDLDKFQSDIDRMLALDINKAVAQGQCINIAKQSVDDATANLIDAAWAECTDPAQKVAYLNQLRTTFTEANDEKMRLAAAASGGLAARAAQVGNSARSAQKTGAALPGMAPSLQFSGQGGTHPGRTAIQARTHEPEATATTGLSLGEIKSKLEQSIEQYHQTPEHSSDTDKWKVGFTPGKNNSELQVMGTGHAGPIFTVGAVGPGRVQINFPEQPPMGSKTAMISLRACASPIQIDSDNLEDLKHLAKAAKALGKQLELVGESMNTLTKQGVDLDHPDLKDLKAVYEAQTDDPGKHIKRN